MIFKIKNYTTSIPMEQTVAELEDTLLRFGASAIMKEYEDGWLKGIRFVLPVEWGKMPIALPANIDGVYAALVKDRKGRTRLTEAQSQQLRWQAERTAWRLMLDWAKVQLSLIRCKQAEPAQVFMPFCVVNEDQGKPVTMFSIFKSEKMKALPPAAAEAS